MSNNIISGWISVEDRLPETDDPVLVWYCNENGDFYPTVGSYSKWFDTDKMYWSTDLDGNEMVYPPVKITHWMPIPEPPKE